MVIRLQSSEELAKSHGVKLLTFAKAGIGKTMLTATAPNPVLISAESGVLSLRRKNIERVFGANNPNITYNIPVIEVKTIDDLTNTYDWCMRSAEAKQFYTLCLDSLSEISEVVLANAKKQVKDPRQAYGELIEKMSMVIRAFRDLSGKNVYFSAKQEFAKDEVNGTMSYVPSMPGTKLGQQLPYFFDEVFCLRIGKTPQGEEFRYLQTQPDFQYDAKDRSGTLDQMEIPNLTHVFNKILGDN